MKPINVKVACLGIFLVFSFFIGSVLDKPIASLFESDSSPSSFASPAKILNEKLQIVGAFEPLPLSFEANQGQTDKRVKFVSRGSGYTFFLTPSEMVLALGADKNSGILRLTFIKANEAAHVVGLDPLPGTSSYLIGNDAEKWHTRITNYRGVRYEKLYPGVDLLFYGNRQQLEFDFIIAPGFDPTQIRMGFDGAEELDIDASGAVKIRTRSGEIRLGKPIVYQTEKGLRKQILGRYEIHGKNRIGFSVADYNSREVLVIDPVLDYSSYLGGKKADQANAIAVDSLGRVYLTGWTSSLDFPTTPAAFQPVPGRRSRQQVFVTKLDLATSSIVYSTYLGGSSDEWASGIAVDGEGNAYVTGVTASKDFPITFGAFQTMLGGTEDLFVTKLNSSGTGLVYSTYVGGSCSNKKATTELSGGIAVDLIGNAYIAGSTSCHDFPTTFGGFQIVYNGGFSDAVVAKLNPLGDGLVYSTYVGGKNDDNGNSIALDADRNVYVTGYTDSPDFPTTPGVIQPTHLGGGDSFVTKLNAAGSATVYSTYLGGRKSNKDILGQHLLGFEWANAVAVDAAGHAYVTGETDSVDFPVTPGSFQPNYGGGNSDGFLTKLASDGSSLIYSTYLGGRSGGGISGEAGLGVAVDGAGNAHVVGGTTAANFPMMPNAFQPLSRGGGDGFIVKFDPEGSAIYSSYLGGRAKDEITAVAIDFAGNAYVTGFTSSKDFPTHSAQQAIRSGSSEAFVAKIID